MIDIKSQIIKPALNLEDLRVVASAEGWKLTDLHSLGFFLNRNFKYRRKITITEQSGSDLTDYQVLIELNSTNFDFSHAQTNGEDIRFTDADGNLLDYWIEEWDAVNEIAKVWVKVPPIPANSSVEISMFYGNSEITSASDGASTFIRIIDGVVGSWHFDEGSGTTAYDSSGNNNHGTLVNGPTWVDGKFGKALDFDGSNDYVDCGNDPSIANLTGSLTISAWIRKDTSGTTKYFVHKGGQSNEYLDYGIAISSAEHPFFGADITDGLISSCWDPDFEFPLNDWTHFVGVYDGSTRKIFINGSELSTTSGSIGNSESSNLNIGRRNDGTGYHDGCIDEVIIFNQALTAEEISDLYNNYGYTTENYPGKVLVRKYTEPEPSISIGGEESA